MINNVLRALLPVQQYLDYLKLNPNPVEIRPHPNDLFTVHINVILRSVRHFDSKCIIEGGSQQSVCPSVVGE